MRVEPARPYKPKDKPKAEQGVQAIQRYILACFRHRKFFSVDELNEAIAPLMDRYNNKVMRHIGKSRTQLFEELELDELQVLPANNYVYEQYKRAKVGIDYHIKLEKCNYSVPFKYLQKEVEVRYSTNHVRISDGRVLYTNRVLYANRHHYMGKYLKDILDAKLVAHYMRELHGKRQAYIHPYGNEKVDITLASNYLYNYITDTVEPGYIIIQYDLSPLITKQTKNIQQELFSIFIGIVTIVLLLLYFYYRYFFTKLYKIEQLTSLLAGKKQESAKLISIDSAIEHLLQTTTEFAIMSRVVQYSNDAILITDHDKKIIAVNPHLKHSADIN